MVKHKGKPDKMSLHYAKSFKNYIHNNGESNSRLV